MSSLVTSSMTSVSPWTDFLMMVRPFLSTKNRPNLSYIHYFRFLTGYTCPDPGNFRFALGRSGCLGLLSPGDAWHGMSVGSANKLGRTSLCHADILGAHLVRDLRGHHHLHKSGLHWQQSFMDLWICLCQWHWH